MNIPVKNKTSNMAESEVQTVYSYLKNLYMGVLYEYMC